MKKFKRNKNCQRFPQEKLSAVKACTNVQKMPSLPLLPQDFLPTVCHFSEAKICDLCPVTSPWFLTLGLKWQLSSQAIGFFESSLCSRKIPFPTFNQSNSVFKYLQFKSKTGKAWMWKHAIASMNSSMLWGGSVPGRPVPTALVQSKLIQSSWCSYKVISL